MENPPTVSGATEPEKSSAQPGDETNPKLPKEDLIAGKSSAAADSNVDSPTGERKGPPTESPLFAARHLGAEELGAGKLKPPSVFDA